MKLAMVTLGVLVSFGLLFASSGTDKPKSSEGVSLEALVELARENHHNIEVLETSFSMVQHRTPQDPDDNIPWIEELEWDLISTIDGSKFYMKKKIKLQDEDDFGPETHFSFDGAIFGCVYIPEHHTASLRSVSPTEVDVRREHRILVTARLLPEAEGGNGYNDGSLVSLLKNGTIREAMEYVNGHKCCVVDVRIDGHDLGSYWLDPAQGAAIIQAVEYGRDGEVFSVTNMHDLHKFAAEDGRAAWLPVRSEILLKFPYFQVRQEVLIDVERTILNPEVREETFRIQLAPGTAIADSRPGDFVISYITEDGSISPPGVTPADAVVTPVERADQHEQEETGGS